MVRKRLMQLAGVLNLVVGLMALLMTQHMAERFHGHGYQFANLEHETYFMGFFFFVFVFGLLYLYVARNTEQFPGIIALSAVGKLGVFGFATFLFLNGTVTTYAMVISTVNDLLMAVFFLWVAFTEPAPADS